MRIGEFNGIEFVRLRNRDGILEYPESLKLGGPNRLKTTGRKISPWNKPKTTTRKKTLKKVRKMTELDVERRTKARKVEMPPLRTAGPIPVSVCLILSSLDPVETMNA